MSKSVIFLVTSFWATFIDIWRHFTGHTACDRQFCFCSEMGNFLTVRWRWSPLRIGGNLQLVWTRHNVQKGNANFLSLSSSSSSTSNNCIRSAGRERRKKFDWQGKKSVREREIYYLVQNVPMRMEYCRWRVRKYLPRYLYHLPTYVCMYAFKGYSFCVFR